jgi:hypothetical protein
MSTEDFYQAVSFTDIRKVKGVEPEDGVRVYCTQRSESWCLQIRGMLMRAKFGKGKDFIVASSSLGRTEMIALRDAINRLLIAGDDHAS